MADPAPAGQYQCEMNIGFEKVGITERYFLTSTTLVTAQQQAYTLCQLRTFLFGSGIVIDKAMVGDLKRIKNTLPVPVAGLGCPYGGSLQPSTTDTVVAPGAAAVGLMYRLQAPKTVNAQVSGWFENRLFRFTPGEWISNGFAAIVPPNGIQSAPPVPAYPGPANYLLAGKINPANYNLTVGYNTLIPNYAGANLFLAYLVQYTCYVAFPYTAAQGGNVAWQNIMYYKVGERQAGKRYEQPKGRYSS